MNVLPTYKNYVPLETSTALIKIGYYGGDKCYTRVENRILR